MAQPSKIKRAFSLFLMLLANFLIGLAISFLSGFYPFEAERKGATPSQYGFVFGIYHLSLFGFSPIFGKYGPKIGVEYLYIGGLVLLGVITTSFAFLEYFQDPNVFIGISYVLRFIEGVGSAMRWGPGVVLAVQLFPDNVGAVASLVDSSFGFGTAVGPSVGVWLYNYGGFKTPFLICGIIKIIISIIIAQDIFELRQCSPQPRASNNQCEEGLKLLPGDIDTEETDTENVAESVSEDDDGSNATILEVLSEAQVSLATFDMFLCASGYWMIQTFLAPHLQPNQISISDTAIAFLISAIFCIMASISTGIFYDRFQLPLTSSVLGNIFNVIYFTFIGPVPAIEIDLTKEIVWGITPLSGTAYGCLLISSFNRMHFKICQRGFTNGTCIISGIWIAAVAFGGFVGPTVAGFLIQAIGFRVTSLIFLVFYVGMLISDITEAIITRNHEKIFNSSLLTLVVMP